MNDYREARQHLDLSQLAYEVLDIDRHEFLLRPSFAGIVNLVLRNYMDDSDASIDNALRRYKSSLEETLAGIRDEKAKEAAIDALVGHYRNELLDRMKKYPKEKVKKVRLDQDNFLAIQEWKDSNDYYSSRPCNFLKAVIEEYARKPLLNREEIALRDRIDELKACINAHQLIVITLRGNTQKGNRPIRYEVRPYSIEHDPGFNYNYLVGYSRFTGTDHKETPASFRISRIVNIRHSHSRSGKVTEEQKHEITKKLRTDGVQFLLQESEPIRLKLTSKGRRMYESQAHLRPPVINDIDKSKCDDGTWIYEFNCTQTQAEYYFFKFGADAYIESPINLRMRFIEKYKAATKAYQQE